ncbi:RhuM family protein, partial [Testudinibacter sp. TR-2022]
MNEIQFLIYDHGEHTEVLVQDETLWATQKSIAQLFGVSVPTINEHLKNIFESGELAQHSTIRKIRIVRQEGNRQVTREIEHYNLDAIISVGYRVNSQKATKFRIWASEILKAYIQKGFAIDIERLRQGENAFGKDYFRELLETVRSIRASEQRIWKQLTDIFAEISYDYDKNSEITRQFYANVQNKFHYA